jgi:hypothetical protein
VGLKQHQERIAWEDRFKRPTSDRLREALPAPAARLFDQVRQEILALDRIEESYAWHGECWRWTVEFRTSRRGDPLAILIPCPDDLQLAIPLEREFTRTLPVRRMKRAVRDGLELARDPFDTRWGVWSIQSPSLLADLADLLSMKLRHVNGAAT